jgi:hypothetical protein
MERNDENNRMGRPAIVGPIKYKLPPKDYVYNPFSAHHDTNYEHFRSQKENEEKSH